MGESIDRLLDMLSMVLSGQPYRPLGAPVTIRPETNGTHSTAQVPGAVKNPELIILALDTLGSFNFKGVSPLIVVPTRVLNVSQDMR